MGKMSHVYRYSFLRRFYALELSVRISVGFKLVTHIRIHIPRLLWYHKLCLLFISIILNF
jgi:hypothetical protein